MFLEVLCALKHPLRPSMCVCTCVCVYACVCTTSLPLVMYAASGVKTNTTPVPKTHGKV